MTNEEFDWVVEMLIQLKFNEAPVEVMEAEILDEPFIIILN